MKSFKSWLEGNMGSAGIDQSPTDTATQASSMIGDFFANAPKGPEFLGDITSAGNDAAQLQNIVPNVAAQTIQFAGQDARRSQIGPLDIMRQMGPRVSPKPSPYFRQFSRMLKKMNKK